MKEGVYSVVFGWLLVFIFILCVWFSVPLLVRWLILIPGVLHFFSLPLCLLVSSFTNRKGVHFLEGIKTGALGSFILIIVLRALIIVGFEFLCETYSYTVDE